LTTALIVEEIQDILQASSYLSYIDDANIFLGVRENVTIFPCLVIEVVGDRLLDETYPYEGRALDINVIVFIKVFDKDKQLAGDTNTKGVLDIENDIRKAISADITLGLADIYDTRLLSTVQDIVQYPIRGFAISLECHYRQSRLTRE
jgi:hypothetical protein